VWGGIYLVLAIMMPLLYLAWLVKRGRITDLDVRLREQRRRPLLVTIVCTGFAWLVLALGLASSIMTAVAVAVWVQVLLMLAVTLRWKISVHAAVAASATTVAWAFLGTPLPLLLGVPLVAWSRLGLRRHTLLQTVAGGLLGFVVFFAATSLLGAR
jgi:membrane-associated phospholipid phosphatase